MDVEMNKQINYLRYMGDKMRIVHTVRNDSPLKPVPEPGHVDLSDGVQRGNLKRQIRVRKKAMAGLHMEIRRLEDLLEDDV
jgi:hypothetical protein